jgi:hypothetical protein
MPDDLFGAQDERHPSTVYEYDDDLFTSMRDLSAMKSRDAEKRRHGQHKDHVGVPDRHRGLQVACGECRESSS